MSEPKKVLYLSYDGLTDPLGQSQILPYIVGLSKKSSIAFTVVSFEKGNAFVSQSTEIMSICDENKIEWIPLTYHKSPPIFSTLFDIWILWQTVKRTQRKNRFQIVHCRSYITSLIGLRAKRKWDLKFIFDMRGFWADERVEGGLWNLRNPIFALIYQFFKKKERQFLEQADHVVSLTYSAKEEIESWGGRVAPITVIPTCVDLELFDPARIKREDQIQLREKLGIADSDFVLLYLGSWGTWYLTREMLNFFAKLKQQNSNTKFLIVSGDQIKFDASLANDIILTKATRQLVPLHISLASLSVCFIKPTFSKKASSATKLGEIMAMNVPVITNSGWGDVSKQSLYGQCTVISNISQMPDQNLLNSFKTLEFPIERKTEFPMELSIQAGIESYHRILTKLIDSLSTQ